MTKTLERAMDELLVTAKSVPVNPSHPNREPWEVRLLNAIHEVEKQRGLQT